MESLCCDCESFCSAPECKCIAVSGGKNYDELDCLQLPRSSLPVVECFAKCRCQKMGQRKCGNSVVAFGPITKSNFYVGATRNKGIGVFSKKRIFRGSFVMEFIGERISEETANQEMEKQEKSLLSYFKKQESPPESAQCYILKVREIVNKEIRNIFIDSRHLGGINRFLNHSCEPNLVMELVYVTHKARVCLFANREIEENEEMTFDYNQGVSEIEEKEMDHDQEGSFVWDKSRQVVRRKCFCASEKCRRVLGRF
eukprot:GHVP01047172.1.p2 GENE.GHVP01047172.1~~GHVP01047172.1.p2  ORF type:complete len:256 (-),score=48.90 GHVP01047172.1:1232-1999(-)